MEGIIFIGIQGSGKSSFYKERFFQSHVRISMDLLNTRNKESEFLTLSLELQQRVVIDNTNPTIEDRKRYLGRFKEHKFRTIGYYFQSSLLDCLARNDGRNEKEKIPRPGVIGTYNKLEMPNRSEGFDEMYYVEIVKDQFSVTKFEYEV